MKMYCLIVRTMTPFVAQGRETKVLLQSELVSLSLSCIGGKSNGGTFMYVQVSWSALTCTCVAYICNVNMDFPWLPGI